MKHIDTALHKCAARQYGVITRWQLLAHGTKDQIKVRLKSGQLERRYDCVYISPSVPPSWEQDELAACVAGGRPNGVASLRAAARLWGLPGGEEIVEVTTARHNRLQYEGVIAHESRFLEERDRMLLNSIPVTRPERTLLDLAGLVELHRLPERTLELALFEAVRRDLVDIPSVWREYERLGHYKRLGGEVILPILERFVAPIRKPETTPETELLFMLREAGFPDPVAQYWLVLPNGERIRLDYAWPWLRCGAEFDPYKFHGDRERYEKNAARTRLMQAMGWSRVTVTDDDLDAGIPQTIMALRTLLAA
ncbi:MAG TPA: hypothetical protein VFX21_01440 [Acidimicrobiia bacterium]|nr:hypothetical protein [Acidimicrobiia bacterium]